MTSLWHILRFYSLCTKEWRIAYFTII